MMAAAKGQFLQLLIINKAGGLIYNQNLSGSAPHVGSNDWLRIGSTFHSLHAIIQQIAPIQSKGIQKLETETFKLQCFQTLTGLKIVLTASSGHLQPMLDSVLQQIYLLYTDYVLKNPFYELDMPIRCELFTRHVTHLIDSYHKQQGTNQQLQGGVSGSSGHLANAAASKGGGGLASSSRV